MGYRNLLLPRLAWICFKNLFSIVTRLGAARIISPQSTPRCPVSDRSDPDPGTGTGPMEKAGQEENLSYLKPGDLSVLNGKKRY